VPGSLLGVFDTDFLVQRRQLRPGDKVVLYSDGLDSSAGPGQPLPSDRLLSAAAVHQALPIEQFIERLAADLISQTSPEDDCTLLGMEAV
jgi:serine phosphatase RsbU (regulator of sigma subunit)